MSTVLNEPSITVTPQTKPEAAPTPAAPTEPAHVPTQEELKQQTIDLYATMGWGKPPEAATNGAPPAPAPEPAAQPTEPGEPAATTPAEPAAEPTTTPAAREPSTTEIIARAARETAREVARELKPAEQPTEEPESPAGLSLTPEDERDFKVIQYLEKTDPAWKGKTDEYLDYVRAHYAYQDKWREDNAGKAYNRDDEEHEAWYDANEPKNIKADDLDRAERDMKIEEGIEARFKPQRDKERAESAFKAALPGIAERVNESVHRMTKTVDESLAELLTERPTDESVKKVEETDPIAFEVMDDLVRSELEPMLLEIEKTKIPELNYALNPANPVHARIAAFVTEKEKELLAAPADERQLDGRDFIPLADYSNRINRISNDRNLNQSEKNARIAEIERDYWVLNQDMVEDLLTDATAKKAKAIIEKRNLAAQRKFKAVAPATNTPAATPAPSAPSTEPKPHVPSALPAGFRPRPPSLGSSGDVVPTATPGKAPQKSFGESALDVAFSR